jgi:hypothetical protein
MTYIWDHTRKLGHIRIVKKGLHINALERFYIYKICQFGMEINNTYSDTTNPVSETLYEHKYTPCSLPPPPNSLNPTYQF